MKLTKRKESGNWELSSKILNFVIFKEKAGVISEKPIWICFQSSYMYVGDNLFDCLKDMWINWKSDKCLIG